jgi:hypothetical protein
MSSWANRQILRKRDISQIPENLRPQIIPRIKRPEVIMSESFHENQIQDFSNSFTANSFTANRLKVNESKKVQDTPINTNRQYIPKRIDSQVNTRAYELTYKDNSYVFVILRHLRNVRDNDLWISSYNSIRKFYSNKIIIIDDNSSVNTVDGKLFNTEIIKSEFNGAGELLPYYYFLQNKWADKMIFLHDSMFINRPFKDSELEGDVKFHWYFNKNDSIDTVKLDKLISLFKSFYEYRAFINNTESIWQGCFGGATIISYDIVKALEEKYNIFTNLALVIKTRKDREIFERIIGGLFYYEKLVDISNSSNFGDILKYPDAFEPHNNSLETGLHIISQKNYDTAIIKVWRGR